MDDKLEKKLDEIIRLLRGVVLTTGRGAGMTLAELDKLGDKMNNIEEELPCQK